MIYFDLRRYLPLLLFIGLAWGLEYKSNKVIVINDSLSISYEDIRGLSVQIPNQIITKSYEVQFFEGNNVIDLDALTSLNNTEYIITVVRLYPQWA